MCMARYVAMVPLLLHPRCRYTSLLTCMLCLQDLQVLRRVQRVLLCQRGRKQYNQRRICRVNRSRWLQ